MTTLEIIYQDDYLVAINKPGGLLVHRSMIDRHETQFALQILRDQIGRRVYPVHRLDKPTSGVLIFALNADIARLISIQFAEQKINKTYQLVVRGYCPQEGRIDHPLKEQFDKITDKLSRKDKPAQSAVTSYKRLATVELPFAVDRYPQSRYSLVEAYPETGRKHQIRRHFKHIAHPIIGDAKHGKGNHNRFFQQQFNCHRLLLACTRIELQHPTNKKILQLNADLDDSFRDIVKLF
ncbi:tRNA pseudouridine(65) synthase TruC [Oceanicoccus sp. KOV_DT_Chl]|uniref:tRNA pseudouridine(65) synthase TruC n=1 Tax=Oceanicoccus sp. KOV_DT_Chl TaxID=1904639 RepID=UPI00350F15B5